MKQLCVDCRNAIMTEKFLGIRRVTKFYCNKKHFVSSAEHAKEKTYMVSTGVMHNPQNINNCEDFDCMSDNEEQQAKYLTDLKRQYKYKMGIPKKDFL